MAGVGDHRSVSPMTGSSRRRGKNCNDCHSRRDSGGPEWAGYHSGRVCKYFDLPIEMIFARAVETELTDPAHDVICKDFTFG